MSVEILALCGVVVILCSSGAEGKKRPNNSEDNRGLNSIRADSERSKIFEGLQDPETSAQAINPAAVQNPLLLQNQAALGGGGLANLGGGVFANQAAAGLGGVNPYLGGVAGYQNPYLGAAGLGGFGGYGGLGVAPDIYTQGALAAQLYNNPLYGAGAGTLSGAAAGINPLLLRGAQNTQYPVIGGLGAYNPYLAAQALLSPYNNYNQLYNYPFSSRFGIGAGSARSGIGRNSNSNDE